MVAKQQEYGWYHQKTWNWCITRTRVLDECEVFLLVEICDLDDSVDDDDDDGQWGFIARKEEKKGIEVKKEKDLSIKKEEKESFGNISASEKRGCIAVYIWRTFI